MARLDVLGFLFLTFDAVFAQHSACRPTGAAIEGPYFKANAPRKFQAVCEGRDLVIEGRVLSTDCTTGVFAQLQVWQADARGTYSTDWTYNCRSTLLTDPFGYFKFNTIVPGRYFQSTGYRPAHIHFTVTPFVGGYKGLTTQLYFKDDPFLGERDSCAVQWCHADDPTLITELIQYNGTFSSRWNIYLEKFF